MPSGILLLLIFEEGVGEEELDRVGIFKIAVAIASNGKYWGPSLGYRIRNSSIIFRVDTISEILKPEGRVENPLVVGVDS